MTELTNRREASERENPLNTINVNLSVSWAVGHFLKYAIIPISIIIYVVMRIDAGEMEGFEPTWENLIALVVAVFFFVFLYLYVAHIYKLITNKNRYLIIDSNGIRSPCRDLSLKWEVVENVTLSGMGTRTFLAWNYIEVSTAEPSGGYEQPRKQMSEKYRWRLDGTDVNEGQLLRCVKHWVKDGGTVRRL